ncbi:nonsense-mediated mRNA decay factor SMG8 [Hetaerina americana]|uniref:nonsense-mediated mRNA decay factor SMG8 n=1 Tax=Hetaerina americana TaxID=62018 RepID=UPI003A7F56CB
MKTKHFKFPELCKKNNAQELAQCFSTDEKVVVISVFGKSPVTSCSSKATALDSVLGKPIFRQQLDNEDIFEEDYLCEVEGYYDGNQRVIFLHLQGVFDAHILVKAYKWLAKDFDQKGYLMVWSKLKYKYARALLFLFSVSHVLIVSHPKHTFDISYIQLFRALDAARQKAQPLLSEILRGVHGLPRDWVLAARPCPPRVLFLFQSCPRVHTDNGGARAKPSGAKQQRQKNVAGASGSKSSDGSHAASKSVKKLEHALEDQIYHILRKTRVITNVSSNSLFAIPANQEFVFVNTQSSSSLEFVEDQVSQMIQSMVQFCDRPSNGMEENGGDYFAAVPSFNLQENQVPHGHTFQKFIHQHIAQAFAKGFDDNVGRHTAPPMFEIPTAGLWFEVAAKVFNFFMNEPSEKEYKTKLMLSCLHTLLDTDVRFSENRCGKVFPLAVATYQENLPPHYTKDYHETRLAHAASVLATHARGPMFEQYATQLEEECEHYWRSGHQMCEVLSLTGNPCTNPLHRTPLGFEGEDAKEEGEDGAAGSPLDGEGDGRGVDGGGDNDGERDENETREGEDEEWVEERRSSRAMQSSILRSTASREGFEMSRHIDVERKSLPVLPHSSGVRYVSTCNCGRQQAGREDPFSVKVANWEFYDTIAADCCSDLESVTFPVFQPSTSEFRAAQLFTKQSGAKKDIGSTRAIDGGRESLAGTQFGNTQGFSFAFLSNPSERLSDVAGDEMTAAGPGAAGGVEGVGAEDGELEIEEGGGGEGSRGEEGAGVDGGATEDALDPSADDVERAVQQPNEDEEVIIKVVGTEYDSMRGDKSHLVRQPSTTEYLPGMLHSDSPCGLLPQFPSWSLVCLGPSSLYSHNLGLQDQPGLLTGSSYLLPWDVTVRLEPTSLTSQHLSEKVSQKKYDRWPSVGDASNYGPGGMAGSRKQSYFLRNSKKGRKDLSEFVVKIFVGVEYECPRGHRFMCSGPDRVLKTTNLGLVKDNGNRVTSGDMPLHFPCPCRNTKPLMAQLMRLHVVTPKAPVHVTLNPRVQPAPGTPIYITGSQEPLRLSQSAYWVLRLPFVYFGEQGPYLPPKEPPSYGRLLAGVYGITEMPIISE